MDDKVCAEPHSLSVILDEPTDSFVPNGFIQHDPKKEIIEDCGAERVGVLDYMPSSKYLFSVTKHRNCATDSAQTNNETQYKPNNGNSFRAESTLPTEVFRPAIPPTTLPHDKDIELKTFSIKECSNDGCSPSLSLFRDPCVSQVLSCASDDDELLFVGADTEDSLQEVVVQSEQPLFAKVSSGTGCCDLCPGLQCSSRVSGMGHTPISADSQVTVLQSIPSHFGANRDVAWFFPDTSPMSPNNCPEPADIHTTATCSTATVASDVNSGDTKIAADRQEDEVLRGFSSSEGQSPSHQSLFDEEKKEFEVHSGLPPLEVVSLERSSPEMNSLSRSNVLYLNDYSLWHNAARAFSREESTVIPSKTEVELRQERRNKRKERKVFPVAKAEEIEGYKGRNELGELLQYINGTDKKKSPLRQNMVRNKLQESRRLNTRMPKKVSTPKRKPEPEKTCDHTNVENLTEAFEAAKELPTPPAKKKPAFAKSSTYVMSAESATGSASPKPAPTKASVTAVITELAQASASVSKKSQTQRKKKKVPTATLR